MNWEFSSALIRSMDMVEDGDEGGMEEDNYRRKDLKCIQGSPARPLPLRIHCGTAGPQTTRWNRVRQGGLLSSETFSALGSIDYWGTLRYARVPWSSLGIVSRCC